MTDVATLYVRNVPPEVVARIRRRAEARGLTVAQYLEKLEALHASMLALAALFEDAEGDVDVAGNLLGMHDLGRVVD